MFESLVDHSNGGVSRRAVLGAIGAAGLTSAALGRSLQPPPAAPANDASVKQPPAAPSSTPAPAAPKPAVGAAAVNASTDLNGAGFYRFKLGGFGGTTLTVLTDGSMPFVLSMFGGPDNASKEDVAAAAAEVMIPPAKFAGHVHGLLIDTNGTDAGRVLVDLGCGSGMGSTLGRLKRSLALAGFTPMQIGSVVLTHGHPDHIRGLKDSGFDIFAPTAQFFAAKAEVDFWTNNPDLSRVRLDAGMKETVAAEAKMIFTALQEPEMRKRFHQLGDGDKVIDGVVLNLAPGHTPGHSILTVTSGNDKFMYLTDVAHYAPIQFPHPDWHVGFDTDPVQAAKTRRALLTAAAADKTLISGAHLPFPAVGYVRKEGAGFAWVPRVWEW